MEVMNAMDSPSELEVTDSDKAFYQDAANYWSHIPATVDGMLGGFGYISHTDTQGSNHFLKQIFKLRTPPGQKRALDCGAGIGRVTKNVLMNHFDVVDLVEQNPAFVEQARSSLGSHRKMGSFYCSGLQDFIPEPATYDVIWCQWVLSHLTDDDLIAFLQACKRGLKPNGVIIVKENVTSNIAAEKDTTDSSVTRPLDHLCTLLQDAGLCCVRQRRQEKLPRGLYPVYMIATRPVKCAIDNLPENEENTSCCSGKDTFYAETEDERASSSPIDEATSPCDAENLGSNSSCSSSDPVINQSENVKPIQIQPDGECPSSPVGTEEPCLDAGTISDTSPCVGSECLS